MKVHYNYLARSSAQPDFNIMDLERINAAWAKAKQAMAQTGPSGPSLDALFLAAYLDSGHSTPRTYTHKLDRKPPAWFVAGVKAMGECAATAASIWVGIRGGAPTAQEARQCGMWLREMGFKPYKSNGRLMFAVKTA